MLVLLLTVSILSAVDAVFLTVVGKVGVAVPTLLVLLSAEALVVVPFGGKKLLEVVGAEDDAVIVGVRFWPGRGEDTFAFARIGKKSREMDGEAKRNGLIL